MTREERINSALLPVLEKMREHRATDEMCKMYDNGFHVGAMWADAHPHWISVEDELPKKDGRYLFYDETSGVYTSAYYVEFSLLGSITHWMPLPQAPKGGEE